MADCDSIQLGFVCVRDTGRSQMASAFAEFERDRWAANVEILTGGTHPAESVHQEVIE
jgi:protein-tyrosine-phosphatase